MKTTRPAISTFRVWMLALRPRTLPAAVAPVMVGSSLAAAGDAIHIYSALAALAGALLLQIAVNLANDYFDGIKGLDGPGRLGPLRVTGSGLISPGRVMAAMLAVMGAAVVVGVILFIRAGWPVLVVGLASLVAVLAYSAGPYPLASHGLGDLCVFIFFGPVAVCGSYYVQALELSGISLLMSVPVGLVITAILVVNNLRDIHTDRNSGKRTLAVHLGDRAARIQFVLLLGVAYACPIALRLMGLASAWVLLSLFSLPLVLPLMRAVRRDKGEALNRALAATARLAFVFSLLLSLGLFLPAS